MALVMWEVLRRTRIGNQETPEYQHPYYDHVETDPNIDEMKNIVVKYRHRPEFDDEICKSTTKKRPLDGGYIISSFKFATQIHLHDRPD